MDVPVYVLTSSKTFSGAESLAYNLKAQERSITIGETTAGGANPGDYFRFGSYEVFVPNGIIKNAVTQTNWEGVGVTPDRSTSTGDAMKKALELINTSST